MNFITVGRENSCNIDIYYEDHGSGQPVVLIHGWPLSSASWERQLPILVNSGYRVITYDRRGFGHSSKPTSGYDYDTLTNDLHTIITKLDLRDVTLVGFSMGGGEVARYLGTHGSDRISKAVFMAAITPCLLKASDNPEGIEESVFNGIQKSIIEDRPAFLSTFLENFYSAESLGSTRISEEALHLSWNIAAAASPVGTFECVRSWLTDFRSDLKKIRIPTLVIHGDDDRTLPLAATAARMKQFAEESRLVVVPGGPHGLNWTHPEEVNRALLDFLKG
ncbi:alpha/beta fold hydrolase [Geobacter sp. DSM 9736]|uniref:alpha/beta fold hydrolase n=1 Tax=Geobacter sp. DSM 9736 TaxID=1277350 RepID=UPI000B50A200|nr:alpha/beta hydrolase [Geobacter sp. DSM 9736]SNB45329.1 Pimeloyl-ACP methyl ester carboxylesterase [Geobacter sp. DSM 9736]